MRSVFLLAMLSFLVCLPCRQALSQSAAPQDQRERAWMPQELKGWEGWALYGQEEALCPPNHNDPAKRQCLFPARLTFSVDAAGAVFAMTWRAFAPQNVPLPTAPGLWPAQVKVDGQPAPVIDQGGVPHVRLTPGEHQVSGALPWKRRPQFVNVSPLTGVVELTLDGQAVPMPRLNAAGRLEITRQDEKAAPEDSFQAAVTRLVKDGAPMTVTTHVRLEVSGRVRAIALDGLLMPGSEPLSVTSPIPAGFGPGGQVTVQAGAGRYDLDIVSRFTAQAKAMGPAQAPFGRETWAFAADPGLRELTIKGLPSIDPQTTNLPEAWKKFPAYVAEKGATLTFETLRRGEPGPLPDEVSAKRTLWLDFDGKGVTARDQLGGRINSRWSLAMTAPGELGRAALNGRDQPVVLIGTDQLRGVEVREAALNMTAESRYPDARGPIPASGWQAGVTSLSAELNLPPGWRLIHAAGPDSVERSWISRFNLLNIFLTLFLALAALKLRGVPAGLALAAYLILAQHERGAPVELWFPLLAAAGLLKALDQPGKDTWLKAAKWTRVFHALALLAMVAASLPFVALQMRQAVYPQLEDVRGQMGVMGRGAGEGAMQAPATAPAPAPAGMAVLSDEEVAEDAAQTMIAREAKKAPAKPPAAPPAYKKTMEQDPRSLVQTGPGLPAWSWRVIRLGWNGPVDPGQRLTLYLVSPFYASALCVARVALLLLALGLLADVRRLKDLTAGAGKTAAAALALLFALGANPAQAGDIPSREMLDELRARLTKPSDCFPNCAGVSSMAVAVSGKALTLTVEAGAAARLALPLPVVSDNWRPQSVTVDGKPAALFAKDGGLWALLEPGAHVVVMSGAVPPGVSFSISSPFAPRMGRVDAPGYSVVGIGPDGALEGGLKLSRLEDPGQAGKPAMTAVIQPFLEVSRVFELGLEWSCALAAKRLGQAGEPVVIRLPLLPGETVIGQNVRVEGGAVVVSLAAGQREASWRTRLEIAPAIDLTAAPEAGRYVETWRLHAAPVWDVTLSGIPVSASLDASGQWSPLWRPLPGEKASIAVTRPGPAPGETVTIDSAHLTVTPGARQDTVKLDMSIRLALGGRHVVAIPQDAEVTRVTVGGKAAPWSGEKPGEIGLALSPGKQAVHLAWRQPRQSLASVSTPRVDLGHETVNLTVAAEMPGDRLVLWAGGDTPLKPAVLLWSAVAVLALIAIGLGFTSLTPLGRMDWFLLGLGLTQAGLGGAMGAVLWLVALGLRRRMSAVRGWFLFNSAQTGIVLLAFVGLSCLFEAIRTGLLGLPNTYITGNGSSAHRLIWFFDRSGPALPETEALSVSLWWYRGFMLAWSLWMALSLIKWLRWGWESFTLGGAWKKPPLKLPTLKGGAAKTADEGRAEESGQAGQAGPKLREGLAEGDGQAGPKLRDGLSGPQAPEGKAKPKA
jgi:hypothetical protein